MTLLDIWVIHGMDLVTYGVPSTVRPRGLAGHLHGPPL